MVDIQLRERTVKVKLVYYGPAVGGKTTNLKVLHERALGSRRGQFVSVNSTQDRTILCDLLPLRTGGLRPVEAFTHSGGEVVGLVATEEGFIASLTLEDLVCRAG